MSSSHENSHGIQPGTHHWLFQRSTAVAQLIFSIWFIVRLMQGYGASYGLVHDWLSSPFDVVMMIMFIINTSYHLVLGFQVVIDDYIHVLAVKAVMVFVLYFLSFILCIAGIVAVMRIYSLGF